MSKHLKPIEKMEFEKTLKNNGFRKNRCNGGHEIWERTQSISLPAHNKEINGGICKRLSKEFNLV